MPNLCKCGCLRPVSGDYFNRHDKWNTTRVSPVDYLIEDRGYKTPCWIWQLKIGSDGYGHIKDGGRDYHAHIYYYKQFNEDFDLYNEDGSRNEVDHLCRVRVCVNWEHLEKVTQIENIRRGLVGKLKDNGHILEIVGRVSKGESQRVVGLDYGISQTQVSRIVHGTRWTNIVGDLRTNPSPKSKITSDQVIEIRRRCSMGESQTDVAKDYGIAPCSVNSIVFRRKWKSIP